MIKRPSRKLISTSSLPLCANVYNYGPGSGGGTGSLSVSRLVPASDVGFSGSGNTIGVLNTAFVPSRIENPERVLFGLTSVQNTWGTDFPVGLSMLFSTSNPVDIVDRVTASGVYTPNTAGSTSGFYFRNEVPSKFFYMIGSTAGSGDFGRRMTIVAIPADKDINNSVISSSPGFVARFALNQVTAQFPASQPTVNVTSEGAIKCSFRIMTPEAIGTLVPVTDFLDFPIGTIDIGKYLADTSKNSVTFRPSVEAVDYVCFS